MSYERSHESFLRHLVVRGKRLNKSGKKKEFDVTPDQVIDILHQQQFRCAITGVLMAHRFNDPKAVSIDRIDSSRGYVSDNVQLVCRWVNIAKGQMSQEQFMALFNEAAASLAEASGQR